MPHSVWRRVRARVHLSLTPVELSNPVRSATKKAFSALLMRYSPELGGAVVAHIGPVELCGPPAFIDASPFAHVAAIATLLVFAPRRGTELLGVVTHVGPDHLGLSVLSTFHAVLPIDGLEGAYRFESNSISDTPIQMWKSIDGSDHATVKRQIRFVICELKPTRTGLFQIIASLDPKLRQNPSESHPLGLLPRDKEITLSTQSLQRESDTVETEHTDVLQVTKRTSAAHASDHLRGDELLTTGDNVLGDALMPTVTPVSALKKKKRRLTGADHRSVSFEDSAKEIRDKQPCSTSEHISKDTASQAVENSNGVKDVGENGMRVSETDETKHRKKRKKEKKKKKKRASSGDVEARSEERSVKPTKHGMEGDEMNSGLLTTTKQEERVVNEASEGREEATEAERGGHSSHKREGKKSKKKKKGKDGSNDKDGIDEIRFAENVDGKRDTRVVVNVEQKTKNEDKLDVHRERSMRRDAEKAVKLGTMEDAKKRKKNKKRRRSEEGEADGHKHRKKKKREKRMNEAMELERRRSLQ